MKTIKNILLTLALGVTIFAVGSCNYNGNATLVVNNVGFLTVTIRIDLGFDTGISHLDPGQQEKYDLVWPGHKDQRLVYTRYPKGQPDKSISDTMTIKDGDYIELDVEFNIEE